MGRRRGRLHTKSLSLPSPIREIDENALARTPEHSSQRALLRGSDSARKAGGSARKARLHSLSSRTLLVEGVEAASSPEHCEPEPAQETGNFVIPVPSPEAATAPVPSRSRSRPMSAPARVRTPPPVSAAEWLRSSHGGVWLNGFSDLIAASTKALERLGVRDEAAVDAVLRAAWASAGPAALPAALDPVLDAESNGSSEEETDEQEKEEEDEEQDGTPPPQHERPGSAPARVRLGGLKQQAAMQQKDTQMAAQMEAERAALQAQAAAVSQQAARVAAARPETIAEVFYEDYEDEDNERYNERLSKFDREDDSEEDEFQEELQEELVAMAEAQAKLATARVAAAERRWLASAGLRRYVAELRANDLFHFELVQPPSAAADGADADAGSEGKSEGEPELEEPLSSEELARDFGVGSEKDRRKILDAKWMSRTCVLARAAGDAALKAKEHAEAVELLRIAQRLSASASQREEVALLVLGAVAPLVGRLISSAIEQLVQGKATEAVALLEQALALLPPKPNEYQREFLGQTEDPASALRADIDKLLLSAVPKSCGGRTRALRAAAAEALRRGAASEAVEAYGRCLALLPPKPLRYRGSNHERYEREHDLCAELREELEAAMLGAEAAVATPLVGAEVERASDALDGGRAEEAVELCDAAASLLPMPGRGQRDPLEELRAELYAVRTEAKGEVMRQRSQEQHMAAARRALQEGEAAAAEEACDAVQSLLPAGWHRSPRSPDGVHVLALSSEPGEALERTREQLREMQLLVWQMRLAATVSLGGARLGTPSDGGGGGGGGGGATTLYQVEVRRCEDGELLASAEHSYGQFEALRKRMLKELRLEEGTADRLAEPLENLSFPPGSSCRLRSKNDAKVVAERVEALRAWLKAVLEAPGLLPRCACLREFLGRELLLQAFVATLAGPSEAERRQRAAEAEPEGPEGGFYVGMGAPAGVGCAAVLQTLVTEPDDEAERDEHEKGFGVDVKKGSERGNVFRALLQGRSGRWAETAVALEGEELVMAELGWGAAPTRLRVAECCVARTSCFSGFDDAAASAFTYGFQLRERGGAGKRRWFVVGEGVSSTLSAAALASSSEVFEGECIERLGEWMEALGRVSTASSVGISAGALRRWLDAHPKCAKRITAQVCGAVSGGADRPDSVRHEWPEQRQPAKSCPWLGLDKRARGVNPGIIVADTCARECCAVDLLRGDERHGLSPASVFVSHSRGMLFEELVQCVEAYAAEHRHSAASHRGTEPSFWIDVFCNNQWSSAGCESFAALERRVSRARPFESASPALMLAAGLPAGVEVSLRPCSCRGTVDAVHGRFCKCGAGFGMGVAALAALREPLQRAWCVAEAHVAVSYGSVVQLTLSRRAEAAWRAAVAAGEVVHPWSCDRDGRFCGYLFRGHLWWGQGEVGRLVDVESAQTTIPEDHEMLLDYCCLVPSLSRTAAEGAKGGTNKGASMPGGWRGDGIKHVAELDGEDAVNAAVAFAVEASVFEHYA